MEDLKRGILGRIYFYWS